MNRRGVVITGMGWVTPMGHDLETTWRRLLAGESGIGPTTLFDADTFPTTFSAEVKNYDPAAFVDMTPFAHAGRNTRFALGAARQAWDMSGLADVDPRRVGVYLGSGEGSLDYDAYTAAALAGWDADAREVDMAKWAAAALEHMHPRREHEQEPNMPLRHVATLLNARGPAFNCLTACAASTQALGEAMRLLQDGDADVMLSGGAHTMIHPLGITGFNRLTALSNRNDDPATASRPFSEDREGFVMGEGAGILVLERLDHARARGATPLGRVAGYGSTADAYRITDIQPEGRGAAAAMQAAMNDAGVGTDAIDWIAAHGTGTQENDRIETRAIKAVFGDPKDGATVPPVSSIKSMLGHLIAAAGSVQAIACVLAIRDGRIPPTANLHRPAADCDLDCVPLVARDTPVRACLSNSFGFGGQNDAVVITAPPA